MHDHGYFCLQIMLVVFTFFLMRKLLPKVSLLPKNDVSIRVEHSFYKIRDPKVCTKNDYRL